MKSERLISIIIISVLSLFLACESKDPLVIVTGVTLNKTNVTLIEGDIESLIATVSPSNAINKNIIWESSNNNIVSVDNSGKVTANNAGSAIITVTTQDGNRKAVSNFTVKEKWISLSQNVIESSVTGGIYNIKITASNNWNVQSIPQWVSITPSGGVGTREDSTSITVTVSPLTGASLSRNGDIIFNLIEKDRSDTITINQYNFPFSDGAYEKIQSSTLGDGIDLVFLGDGYTIEDIRTGKFKDNLNEGIFHFFDIEPYRTYRDYFDIYIVYAFSEDSGISDHITTKNTKFSSKYDGRNSTRMTIDNDLVFEYAQMAPLSTDLTETLVTVITNSTRFAGTTWSYSDGKSIAIVPVSNLQYPNDFRGALQHEAVGHGFGMLADEYVQLNNSIPAETITELKKWQGWGYFRNIDVTNDANTILWKHFIGDPAYSYVGAIEGGYTYASGVWRPESSSLMNNNITYINAPSRELIVKKIKTLAGETYSFDEFKSRDVRETQALTRSVTVPADTDLRLPPPILIKVE